MRNARFPTRVWGAILLTAAAAGAAAASRPPPAGGPGQPAPGQTATRPVGDETAELLRLVEVYLGQQQAQQAEIVLADALQRLPDHVALRIAWIDAALVGGQHATALERVRVTLAHGFDTAGVHWRAAQAHFALGQFLGEAVVQPVRGGRAGQFAGPYLLVEERGGRGHFLCSPQASALHQVRLALDMGLDERAAHVLHARIWQRLGRSEIGLTVLLERAAVLLRDPDNDTLAAFADLARDAGDWAAYLHYERRRAERTPAQRGEILHAAYRHLAECFSQRGDEASYLVWLERAAAQRPADAEAALEVADAAWAVGRATQAADWYRRVLSLRPDHPERGRIAVRLADSAADTDGGEQDRHEAQR